MNYLREINAFARRMRRAPLSTNAQLLWYKLMDLANVLRWPDDVRKVFYYIKEQTHHEDGQWTMTFPEEKKELLAYAFDQARTQGKLHWGYIGGIYDNFRARGIKTVDDAMDYEEMRRRR